MSSPRGGPARDSAQSLPERVHALVLRGVMVAFDEPLTGNASELTRETAELISRELDPLLVELVGELASAPASSGGDEDGGCATEGAPASRVEGAAPDEAPERAPGEAPRGAGVRAAAPGRGDDDAVVLPFGPLRISRTAP